MHQDAASHYHMGYMVNDIKTIVDYDDETHDHVLATSGEDVHQTNLFNIIYRGYIIFEVSQLSNIMLTNPGVVYPDTSRWTNHFVVLPKEYNLLYTQGTSHSLGNTTSTDADDTGIMTNVDDMGIMVNPDHPIFVYHLNVHRTDANDIKSIVDYEYEDETHDHVLAKSGEDVHQTNLFNIINHGYIIFEVSQLSSIMLTIRDYHPDVNRWRYHFMVLPKDP